MKTNIKFLFTLLLIISISGCKKNFLERYPSQNLSDVQLQEASITNPDIASGMVKGIYSKMIETYAALGGENIFEHDDFGQKSIDITTDIICGDMAFTATPYGHFRTASQLNTTATDEYPNIHWKYLYKIVKSANEVIDGLGGNDAEITSAENNAFYGQAKALRAHAYFNLANLYQHNYENYSGSPCVPLYDSQLEGLPLSQSSLAQVYELIIDDLEDAVTRLAGYSRGSKIEINEYVAKGLLAYAYLTTGQYNLAASTAQDVIENSGYSVMSADEIINSGFNSVNIPGWMWAIDLTTDNTGSLLTFWGHVDIFTYSYAGVGAHKGMDDLLYSQIPVNDIRKNQFVDAFGNGALLPIWKFYDAGRTVFGDRTWTNDEVFMRIAEMYLIQAEALARAGGNDVAAQTALLGLISDRDPDAETRVNALSGQALLDEIYLQWRVEMWGEGKSYWAMKRFKATVTRGTNHEQLPLEVYQHNDDRVIMAIPEDELNNNPMLNSTTPSNNTSSVSPPKNVLKEK